MNPRHTHPAVDRFWSGLSGFADRGVLWWTLAGVLAVTGRRRAAARGLLSLVAASGLTNLIAKQVFGGDRPLLADVPIGRRLPKHPVTPSFPSGHSASAAAFAAGVALERPRIGAALAPVALGVGYSRLHTGRTGCPTSWAAWRSAPRSPGWARSSCRRSPASPSCRRAAAPIARCPPRPTAPGCSSS